MGSYENSNGVYSSCTRPIAKERGLMRVCFVSHTAARNGAELALLELLQGLHRLGVQCLVFVPKKGPLLEELDKLNIEWRLVSYPWWWKLRGKSLPRRVFRTLHGFGRCRADRSSVEALALRCRRYQYRCGRRRCIRRLAGTQAARLAPARVRVSRHQNNI